MPTGPCGASRDGPLYRSGVDVAGLVDGEWGARQVAVGRVRNLARGDGVDWTALFTWVQTVIKTPQVVTLSMRVAS